MKTPFAIALLGLLTAGFFWERRAMEGLRAQNESLRPENSEAAQLANANRELPALRATAGTAKKTDRAELLRLRNEVRRLRVQQQEIEKLRAANQRVADEIKSGKFTSRRLADMEGALPREKWTFAGFATPEAAVQSFFAAVSTGDAEQIVRCMEPQLGESLRQGFENDPERFRQKMLQVTAFASVSVFRIVEKQGVSDDEVEVRVQATVDGARLPLEFRRISAEWKLDRCR
jgi:hypothetical protein